MKLCKDCWHMLKHSDAGLTLEPMYWKCGNEPIQDYVTGAVKYMFCDTARSLTGKCGSQGNFFLDRKERDLEIKRENMTYGQSFGSNDE